MINDSYKYSTDFWKKKVEKRKWERSLRRGPLIMKQMSFLRDAWKFIITAKYCCLKVLFIKDNLSKSSMQSSDTWVKPHSSVFLEWGVRSVYNGTESISFLAPHIRNLVPAYFKELISLKLINWIIHFCHEFFRCLNSSCRARLQTNVFNVNNPQLIIVHNVSIHNHPPNVEAAQRHGLVQQLRDQIRENPAQRVH